MEKRRKTRDFEQITEQYYKHQNTQKKKKKTKKNGKIQWLRSWYFVERSRSKSSGLDIKLEGGSAPKFEL